MCLIIYVKYICMCVNVCIYLCLILNFLWGLNIGLGYICGKNSFKKCFV